MTKTQLNLLCDIKNISSPTREALRLHLFNGQTLAEAARSTGVLPQNICRARNKVMLLNHSILEAYK